MKHETPIHLDKLRSLLIPVVAPWVAEPDLQRIEAQTGDVRLALPISPKHAHADGVPGGQSLMAAAGTGMILAICTGLGEIRHALQ